MPNTISARLNLFRYAAGQSIERSNIPNSFSELEHCLASDMSSVRLHALVQQNALDNSDIQRFNISTQSLLKVNTIKLVVDIGAKLRFIQQLISMLEQQNIAVILLKGMAFNGDIYSLSCPRGVSDIDILIQPQDKERFDQYFAEFATKVVVEKKYSFDDLYEEAWRSNDEAKHLIDVHTHLTNPKLFNIEQTLLWQMSKPHPHYGSNKIRVLSTEHTLLHIVTHVINDTNFYHYNLVDVTFLLLKYQVDYVKLEKVAKSWGVRNATGYLFSCVNRCTDSQQLPYYPITGGAKIRAYFAWLLIDHVFILESREKSFLHRFKQINCYIVIFDEVKPALKVTYYYFKEKIKRINFSI
tara:strand:- start:298 stop:1362 length:1065 start_codon:yes stop_codon:yes gene_type:complete